MEGADDEVAQFVQPKNVLHLTNEQLDWEIAARQQSRLAAFRIYSELQAKVRETRNEKLKVQLGKICTQIEKSLAAVDKALAKTQELINKSRGIRLELDDKFDIKKEDNIYASNEGTGDTGTPEE
jgi:uncharacterized protein YqgV (UPF0045/DUF77 family)